MTLYPVEIKCIIPMMQTSLILREFCNKEELGRYICINFLLLRYRICKQKIECVILKGLTIT